ncbi:hypothetical protein JAAARDRAFT_387456 [Jaapia argillacea MUCL 33604]|uniref:Uncharacterized protein n=1 Tax=Jaapia argillacea MUCL 33604 TaxID=933084 RepID=A0A067QM15_9AGAM|nr:hypothetical protein JAAARDRAFT_387456 [Jaapia argillacea MUCL 33604]
MSEVYHSSPVTPSSPCDSEQLIYPPSIPLHHPIPVSYLPPLSASPDSTSEYEPFPAESSSVHTMDRLHFEYQNLPDSYLGDRYPAAPANLFPTPSELLTEMSSREASQRAQAQIDGYESNSRKPESQRKARQRVVAETIGFTQTDPDSISSHDKKRYYLESLEQYVLYLQDQFRLLEHTPVALERVSTYRGLSSRSVRTLLVHMEGEVKKANDKTSEEERLFVDLRDQLVSQEASAAAQPFRRYSAP